MIRNAQSTARAIKLTADKDTGAVCPVASPRCDKDPDGPASGADIDTSLMGKSFRKCPAAREASMRDLISLPAADGFGYTRKTLWNV